MSTATKTIFTFFITAILGAVTVFLANPNKIIKVKRNTTNLTEKIKKDEDLFI